MPYKDEQIDLNKDKIVEEEWPTAKEQGKPWPLKAAAALVLIAFLSLALGSFLQVFNPPSFQLLLESRQLNKDPFVRELHKAVVEIRVTRRSGGSGELKGTGFNIRSEGLIVTNRHLVEDAVLVSILFPGQGTFRAENWRSSPAADLAVVSLAANQDLPVVALEEIIPKVGEKVFIIGNPLSFLKVAMSGEVENHRMMGIPEAPLLEIKAPIQQGNSGSPVFNGDGKVVAVVFATIEGIDGDKSRGLALPVALLEPLLKEGTP